MVISDNNFKKLLKTNINKTFDKNHENLKNLHRVVSRIFIQKFIKGKLKKKPPIDNEKINS